MEVLVIDNNSSDHTREVVESFSPPFPLHYIFEPVQGLSHARNRGWKEAKGQYVAYLDDDATAPTHWLELAIRIARDHSPVMFGGPVRDVFENRRPSWHIDFYLDSYKMGAFGKGPIGPTQYFIGANLVLNRDVLAELGGFHASFGMRGTSVAYGEESYVVETLRAMYPSEQIYGHPDLWVYHLVRPQQTSLRWMMRSFYARGRDTLRLHFVRSGSKPRTSDKIASVAHLVVACCAFVAKVMVAPSRWSRVESYSYPNMESYVVSLLLSVARKIGWMVEMLQFPPDQAVSATALHSPLQMKNKGGTRD